MFGGFSKIDKNSPPQKRGELSTQYLHHCGLVSTTTTSTTQAARVERQWGDLDSYRGIATTASGASLVAGLKLGNVWLGVQPALGVEGDPMRLLFERDLTPHPQYAAFYKWLQVTGCPWPCMDAGILKCAWAGYGGMSGTRGLIDGLLDCDTVQVNQLASCSSVVIFNCL